MAYQHAGEPYESAVGKHLGQIVEGSLPAYVGGLCLFVKRGEVDAVGGYVMCGAGEGYDSHHGYGEGKEVGQRQQEGYQPEAEA